MEIAFITGRNSRERINILIIILAAILVIGSIIIFAGKQRNHELNAKRRKLPTVTTMVESLPDLPMEQIAYADAEEEIEMQEEDLLYLQKIVYAEAQGESIEGKVLVAASVVNRKNDQNQFPNTIKEVIEQKNQYASTSWITEEFIENMNSWQKAAWDDCREAAERALAGEDPAAAYLGGPTLYFYNPDKCSQEHIENREGILMYVEGNHHFHHEPPRG